MSDSSTQQQTHADFDRRMQQTEDALRTQYAQRGIPGREREVTTDGQSPIDLYNLMSGNEKAWPRLFERAGWSITTAAEQPRRREPSSAQLVDGGRVATFSREYGGGRPWLTETDSGTYRTDPYTFLVHEVHGGDIAAARREVEWTLGRECFARDGAAARIPDAATRPMSWWNRCDAEPWDLKARAAGIDPSLLVDRRAESVTTHDPDLAARFGVAPGERITRADWLIEINFGGEGSAAYRAIRAAAAELDDAPVAQASASPSPTR